MCLIDDQQRGMLSAQLAQLMQRRHIAIHREDRIGGDDLAAWRRGHERRQMIQIAVSIDRHLGLGQAAAIDDGRWAEKRIGHDRASRTYAFRTFLNDGVRVAFGTDWNVAPLNPMLTLYAATTRATLDGKNPNGWFPEQKLTVGEAVQAYTMGSAYAEFQDQEKGSITPGKLADMVIVNDDIFQIDPVKIRDVKVTKTIVGGKVVWEAPSGAAQ